MTKNEKKKKKSLLNIVNNQVYKLQIMTIHLQQEAEQSAVKKMSHLRITCGVKGLTVKVPFNSVWKKRHAGCRGRVDFKTCERVSQSTVRRHRPVAKRKIKKLCY